MSTWIPKECFFFPLHREYSQLHYGNASDSAELDHKPNTNDCIQVMLHGYTSQCIEIQYNNRVRHHVRESSSIQSISLYLLFDATNRAADGLFAILRIKKSAMIRLAK